MLLANQLYTWSLIDVVGQQQEQAEARALQQGIPSTSLVMRVLREVAHELAGRRKAQREKDFASAGKGALSGFGALRAAFGITTRGQRRPLDHLGNEARSRAR